jgi:hypothetical protein
MNIYAAYHSLSPAERQYYEQVALQTNGAAWVDQFKRYYNQYARDAAAYQQGGGGGGSGQAGYYATLLLAPAVKQGAKKGGIYLAEQLVGKEAAKKVAEEGTKVAVQQASPEVITQAANASVAQNASSIAANYAPAVSSVANTGLQLASSGLAQQAAANSAGIGTTSGLGLSSGGVEALNAVAAGPTVDAANLAATQGASQTGTSTLASVAPYLGAAAGAYGLYSIADNWGAGDRSAAGIATGVATGAASGAAVGSAVPVIGTAAGAIVGALYGLAGTVIKSGKHIDQKRRDGMRDALENIGFAQKVDGSHHVRLMDGGSYDIGRELEEVGVMGDTYNIDLTDEESRKIAGWLTPLAVILAGQDPDDAHVVANLAGYLTNAAKTQQDPVAQVKDFYAQVGLDHASAFAMLTRMGNEGKLDHESHVFMNDGLNQLFDPNYDFGERPWWSYQPDIPDYARTIDGAQHPLAGTRGEQPVLDANAPQDPNRRVSAGPNQEAYQQALQGLQNPEASQVGATPQEPAPSSISTSQQNQQTSSNLGDNTSSPNFAPTDVPTSYTVNQQQQGEDVSLESALLRLGAQQPQSQVPSQPQPAMDFSNLQPVPRPGTGAQGAPQMPEQIVSGPAPFDMGNAPQHVQDSYNNFQQNGGFAKPNAGGLPPAMGTKEFYYNVNAGAKPTATNYNPLTSGGMLGSPSPVAKFQSTYYPGGPNFTPGPNDQGVPGHQDFAGFGGGNMYDAFKYYLSQNPMEFNNYRGQ